MGDKKKREAEAKADLTGATGFLGSWGSALMGGAMGYMLASMVKSLPRKRAFQLSPGDIILVGHIHILVVEVVFATRARPTEKQVDRIQVVGAPCVWRHQDWAWSSNEVLETSPFLRFFPMTEVEIVREAPDCRTVADAFREFQKEAEEAEQVEAAKARKDRAREKPKDPDAEAEPAPPKEPEFDSEPSYDAGQDVSESEPDRDELEQDGSPDNDSAPEEE